jgi:hypothetical protein
MSITQPSEAADSVRSADGTVIGYRQVGGGPGIVLVRGGGQSSQNLMTLAGRLSDRFTVYVPDRRGRGMSGPYREDHGLRHEIEDLAKLRAAVVQMSTLADVARGLNLGAYLRLGHGEESTGGRDKASVLAGSLEAVIGAIYLDIGLEKTSALIRQLFDPVIERSASLGAGLDWKTSLQELTAMQMLGVPEYLVEESGPDHQKSFSAVVKIAGRTLGSGEGRSKKAAEQQAAQAAWTKITRHTS